MKYLFFTTALLMGSLWVLGEGNLQNDTTKGDRRFTPKQLKEDYRILIKTLQEAYPSTYRYNTKAQLNLFFKSVMEKFSAPMTEKQFYPLIALTTAKMKDEHIISTPSNNYYENVYKRLTRFLPFNIKLINKKIYVCKSNTPQLQVGTEILSIDGIAAGEVIRSIINHIYRDGYISTFPCRHIEDYSPTQNENIFDLNYSFLYHLKSSVKLKIKRADNSSLTINCKSLNYREYQTFYQARNPHELPLSFKQLNPNTALLQISSFHSYYRELFKQNFDNQFESIFNQLDSNRTKNLIIDLRRCEGGDNSYLLLLSYVMTEQFKVLDYIEVSYVGLPSTAKYLESTDNAFFADSLLYRTNSGMYRLKRKYESTIPGYTSINPNIHNFKGNLYILSGGATGSAAAIFCSVLRNYHRATFVGEETGGAMNGPTSLNIPILILPNTKIKVEIPLVKLQLAVNCVKGRGVIPDYTVHDNVQDLIDNKDTQMEFMLKLSN